MYILQKDGYMYEKIAYIMKNVARIETSLTC